MSRKGSDVHFVFNPQWKNSSCAESLRLSDFNTENSAFVCYADVLFRRSLVCQMLAESRDDCGIVVAVDFDSSLLKTKEDYETICIDKIHYPFVGCVYFRPQALKNYNIGGLITAYGGPNSHISIRASEFNLPASIGVGEGLFNKLKFARLVRLDCAAHQLMVLG